MTPAATSIKFLAVVRVTSTGGPDRSQRCPERFSVEGEGNIQNLVGGSKSVERISSLIGISKFFELGPRRGIVRPALV